MATKRNHMWAGILIFLALAMSAAQIARAQPPSADNAKPVDDPKIIRAIEALGSSSAEEALKAEQELLQLGEQATLALLQALREAPPPVRERAKTIVAKQVTRHVENLVSSTKPLADAAEASLVKLKYQAVEALEEVVKAEDPDRAVRASRALKKILSHTHVVLDALGQPIAEGRLELAQQVSEAPDAPPRTIESSHTSDERGYVNLEIHKSAGRVTSRLHHPDYGDAQRIIHNSDKSDELRFPLVKRNTAASARAMKGTVVSQDFKPIAGACISSHLMLTPANGVHQVAPEVSVIADPQGRFVFYPVATRGAPAFSFPVARATKYKLQVSVPADPSIFPRKLEYDNPHDTMIKLQRAERFHKFKFASATGGFLKENEINRVTLAYAREAKWERVDLDPALAPAGGKLLAGFYFARFGSKDYLPLTVTGDSPEELTFRFSEPLALKGRVLHGITGKPIEGAFVLGFAPSQARSLAQMPDEEWRQLRELPKDVELADRALSPLTRYVGLQAFTRTDELGRYTLVQKPAENLYGVLAMAQDYLPIQQSKSGLEVGESEALVPDLLLFPAAKVLVQTPGVKQGSLVVPTWRFEKEGQPDWFPQFLAATDAKAHRSFSYDAWMTDKLQAVYVPADVRVNIDFSSPADDVAPAGRTTKAVQVKPGETEKIGEITMTAPLEVEVEVVDEQGAPVPGVNVRRLCNRAWAKNHRTDDKGRAKLRVNPHSSGSFGAWLKSGIFSAPNWETEPNLFIPFEVQEEAPTNPQYKITLTAEQIKTMVKPPAGGK
ncbi:MAG TPA: hypothetical protein VGJ26_19170 [Pirellulales bacterium]|jgi:hypothetical protein